MSIDIERLKWDEVAPDGATHYVVNSTYPWEKRVLDNWYYLDTDDDRWRFLKSAGDARITESPLQLPMFPRPEPATEWDGEGLPPVGCECEYMFNRRWIDAKVIGYDGPACVVALDGFGYVGSTSQADFRPIRTKAEREREYLEYLIESAYVTGGVKGVADAIQANYSTVKE